MRRVEHYHIKQEGFEGPLDLLLDLIEREKLPINEISLSRVADGYLTKVKLLKAVDQESLAEFLVIAAQLMLIKSRSLLPHLTLTEEEVESIDELEKRIREYKRIKELARGLKQLEASGHWMYSREALLGLPIIFYPPPALSPLSIAEAFRSVLQSLPQLAKLAEEKLKKIISLDERIREIQMSLQRRIENMFSDIIAGSTERVEIVVSFLAILELAKQKLVILHQGKLFGDIAVSARVEKE